MTTRRILIPAALATLALFAAGFGSDDDNGGGGGGYGSGGAATTPTADLPKTTGAAPAGAAKDAVDVSISNFKFVAPDVVVKTGGTVTWTNDDSAAHTATDDKGAPPFDTGTLDEGDSKKGDLRR